MKQLIIALLFVSVVLGQKKYVGRISDEQKIPLPDVIIKVFGDEKLFYSDFEGKFSFYSELNPETKVQFSRLGYEDLSITLNDLSRQKNWIMKSKVLVSQTVLVKATLGEKGESPMTFSELNKNSIKKTYSFQDVPEMLSYLPSTSFYSEGGNGIGYNYLNIRGFDQRRISVSVNGIPQNDPEDHNVYWIDFPDILQDAELIQVQRGSGSGIVGYPSLGGSINIISSSFSNEPKFEFSSVVGSYNSRKLNLALASGLINNKYSLFVRFSKFQSEGYRDNNWVDLKSYYLSAVRFDDNITSQLNIFGAPIADGLTYTGLPKFAVKNKLLRKGNYSYWESDNSDFTYSLKRRKDEIENFYQPHIELLNDWKINDEVKFNSALFLVTGEGFFDYDGSWADSSYFRLTKQNGFPFSSNPGNALIRAYVKNNQWGWIPKLSVHHQNGTLFLGGEFRFHKSLHFGNINYAENLPQGVNKNYNYYEYKASKKIINFFLHDNYKLNESVNLMGEIQFSYNRYRLYDEKYVGTEFTIPNFFINPRIGVNFKFSPELNCYFAISKISKEPRLKNYYDAAESGGGAVPQFAVNSAGKYDFSNPLVKPENMISIESGMNYITDFISVNLNGYYMMFSDEIVNQGQLDRFGQPVTGNIDKSVHTGIELSLIYKPDEIFEADFNSTFSKNYISKGFYYIDENNSVNLSGNKISGFPNFMFNMIFKVNYNNIMLQLSNKFVGDFYSDNFDDNLKSYLIKYPDFVDYADNRNESYFISNLMMAYETELNTFVNKFRIFMQINNLWNNYYSAFAIGKEYFPAAERNFAFGMDVNL
jgi:iron complex outermembrane receptor protein